MPVCCLLPTVCCFEAFLREQFDLWLYQNLFSGESECTEQRIKQLQGLKDIALKNLGFGKSPPEARNMGSVSACFGSGGITS
jgi:hypothetical protein